MFTKFGGKVMNYMRNSKFWQHMFDKSMTFLHRIELSIGCPLCQLRFIQIKLI